MAEDTKSLTAKIGSHKLIYHDRAVSIKEHFDLFTKSATFNLIDKVSLPVYAIIAGITTGATYYVDKLKESRSFILGGSVYFC